MTEDPCLRRPPEMTIEEAAYELPEIWEDVWFSAEERERVRAVSALVPADARTIADVGCGNGLFVNGLRDAGGQRFDRIVGVDRSAAALAHVTVARCRARVDALPFRDRSFDLVSAMEVLEHLPVGVFPLALTELSRMARKYLLVAVPYRQDLKASLSRCPSCHSRFNADFHVRSFDEGTLSRLFDGHGFRLLASHRLGTMTTYLDQSLLTRFATWIQGRPGMPAYAICPVCGFHDAQALRGERMRRAASPPSVVRTRPGRALRTWIAPLRPRVTTYRWICALYAR